MKVGIEAKFVAEDRVLRGDVRVFCGMHDVVIIIPCGGHKIMMTLLAADAEYLVDRLQAALKEVEAIQDEKYKVPEVRHDRHTGQAIADYQDTFDWWSTEKITEDTVCYVHIKKFGASVPLKCLTSVLYADNRFRNVGLLVQEQKE